ncbi:hypothetical protein BC629DRAFT_1525025 [Irpex lacteus]|nr:hypothetical protein BC629DRAFT_1525025 [Irpex lacteus]
MQRLEDSLTTPLTSTSQFIQADDDDDLDEEAIPGPAGAAGPLRTPTLSGNIGSGPASGVPSSARRTIGGFRLRAGVDTLDEPVTTTIGRDLLSIYTKLVQVLYPPRDGGSREVYGTRVSIIGNLTMTIQQRYLLGGRVSFFQGLCVFGYCVAPSTLLHLFSIRTSDIRSRSSCSRAWAWCPRSILDGTKIEQQRIVLAVYPLLLFYFILAWMIIIQ